MNDFPFGQHKLHDFLVSHFKTEDVEITDLRYLEDQKNRENLKKYGYGSPILIELLVSGMPDQLVLHTVRKDKYGHERQSDRARNILLDYNTFNKLPRHVPCLDVGAFSNSGDLISLASTGEFFLITQFIPGKLYADDLKRLSQDARLLPEDKRRCINLANYLADIHSKKQPSPSLYKRCIRDLLGHGEGIMGVTDSYAPDFPTAPPSRLQAIEQSLLQWRWQINHNSHRLSQVHGDFHPWNILFEDAGSFYVLDRSRGEWGEPADDMSAMTINYIFFSLQNHPNLAGPFKILFESFWDKYLQMTQDVQILSLVQPFFAWRALVLANPIWYPNISIQTREVLFNFIESVLSSELFDPKHVNAYLG
jgi:thiamine kinase-like enzyme